MWRNRKGKIRRVWKFLAGFILVLYFLPLIFRWIPFGMNVAESAGFFKSQAQPFKDSVLMVNGQKVRFISTGVDTGRMILFIHGSPGSWSDLKDYLVDTQLRKRYHLVAFDRPGYGNSGGNGYAHLADQAIAAHAVLSLNKNARAPIVFGHSYGGPVAVKLATLYPTEVGGLFLISPTVAPQMEEKNTVKRAMQWYSRFWLFRWMMDPKLLHSTQEMQPLPNEVREMEQDFAKITCPVVEFHGTKDWMAPYPNQKYICDYFKCTRVDTVTVIDGDHFLVWSMHPTVVNKLLELAK